MVTTKNNEQENGTETIFVPNVPEIAVTRNDVELVYKEEQLKKGKDKGWKYPSIVVTQDNLSKIIGYMGDKLLGKINTIFRQLTQGWWEEALEDAKDKVTGTVDLDKAIESFKKLATDFSARGESLPELKERINELVDQMTDLSTDDPEWATKFASMSAEIKQLKLDIEAKRRPRSAKTEED